ncbi:hypothetical protein [Cohnella sp.]|jgi:hypothetical protein|uniref:hypothetical protein n=1 Tax=Cohnella sp. TaxID=1883426 RepID=UPI0035671719
MKQDGSEYRAIISEVYTQTPFPLIYFFTIHDESGMAWQYPGFEENLSNQPYFVLRQQERLYK